MEYTVWYNLTPSLSRDHPDLLPEVEAVQELVEAAVQQTQAARWSVLGLSSRVDSLNIATGLYREFFVFW